MFYLMRNSSNISIRHFIFVLPTIFVEFIYIITIDDDVMRDAFLSTMNCVEVGFSNRHLHVCFVDQMLKEEDQFYFRECI